MNLKRKLIIFSIAIGILFPWLYLVYDVNSDIQKQSQFLALEEASLRKESGELKEYKLKIEEIESQIQQSRLWKVRLKQIYKEFRSVDDFVLTKSPYLVATALPSQEGLNLVLPKGNFQLLVSAEEKNRQTLKRVGNPSTPALIQMDLPGSAGYQIQLLHEPKKYAAPAQLFLTIQSTNQKFEAVRTPILKPFISLESSANILEPIHLIEAEEIGRDGVTLLRRNWHPQETVELNGDRTLEIDLTIKKRSTEIVGPPKQGK